MPDFVVPLFKLRYEEEEIKQVTKVLKEGWLSFGPQCLAFEKELGEYLGGVHSVFLTSATAGLHILYSALFKPEDEVLVPSFTFIATVSPLLHLGVKPVFVDIESLERPVLSIEDAKNKLTNKTRALVFMHYAGYLTEMKAVKDFCEKNGIILIEDAAHALGAKTENQYAGTFGIAGVFSFFANKNLSTGEGGAVVTKDENLYQKLKLLRSHGMTSSSWERFRFQEKKYEIKEIGFNYSPTEIQGVLARTGLRKLDSQNRKREEIIRKFREDISSLCLIPFDKNTPSSNYIFPIFLHEDINREEFIQFMHNRGIQTSHHYFPVHQFNLIQEKLGKFSLPVTEFAGKHQVTLPLYPDMTPQELNIVVNAIREFIA